jgi:hypothetical protein
MKRYHLTLVIYQQDSPREERATKTIKCNVLAENPIEARRNAIHAAWANKVQVEKFLRVREVQLP